ncbi:MAG: CDP-alcohol phosphatidyltransferase family protein [Candidatus Krumholzibacteriota bacterium]|jgi:CDP-diacylglycerol--glycerol-3-phosphate 3-phosphatidyltransferase|nr:CDP-alcohol phosphatidyltransferase family protein [Candidatus Krumholzibacteriota bacterium]
MTAQKQAIQSWFRRWLDPLTALVHRLGISPDALTLTGLVLSLASAVLIAGGRFLVGAIVLLVGSLCDVLDGSLARRGGRANKGGAFLDSTLDRFSEIAVYLGLLYHYRGSAALQLICALALTGSLMTSYARARAEGLDIDCKVGLLERPERLAMLIVGLVAAPLRVGGVGPLELVLTLLAILTYVTTFQRIAHVMSRARDHEPEPVDAAEPDGEALSASSRQP